MNYSPTIAALCEAETAQAELEQLLEDQSEAELIIDDFSCLAEDILAFLQKRERLERTCDPELSAEVDKNLDDLKARVKGLAVQLGFVREVLDSHDESLKQNGLRLQLMPIAS